jgi:serine/threonine protein kinase
MKEVPPWVDQVCNRFEDRWRAAVSRDQQPRIEDFLADTPPAERSALVGELVAVDLAYRRRHGEQPRPEEYQQRFPEHASLMPGVFENTVSPGPPGLPKELPESGPETGSFAEAPSTPASVEPPAPHPVAIGKYRVVEWLGRGGQAEVFRAVHPHLPGRDVVIKWARRRLTELVRQQFLAEGQVLAGLEEAGVARVYDVDVYEDRPFVVMEYLRGRSLQQVLAQRRPAPREAAALVAVLADSLDRVHRRGVCHRDLKPANVLIDDAGRPRLVDFGLALAERPWDQSGRQEEGVSGTFQYMAPEQANGQTERIGPRSDIFGLGSILYALLTGRPPPPGRGRH